MAGGSGEKYRSFMSADGKTQWRHGDPPQYDVVNKLFEQERTQLWGEGSLEEIVQNAVKTWEMEFSHKIRLEDFKTIDPNIFNLVVNGKKGISAEETLKIGSYNALLKNCKLGKELQLYKAEEETFESSHEAFGSAFPRGFAWEVISVFSGPPVVVFKFRHWGHFEGPFKGHSPTGDTVEMFGIGILKVNDKLVVQGVEVYYDPADLIGGLFKGQQEPHDAQTFTRSKGSCPFSA
ncbi:Pathogen-related protein [Linum perenne]